MGTSKPPFSVRLDWEGKRTTLESLVHPPRLEWITGATPAEKSGGTLIHGDCLAAMQAMLPMYQGAFNLIYLDPPYFSGANYQARKDRRNVACEPENMSEAFDDRWQQSLPNYLQWLYDRLLCVHNLLAEDGCLYLHLDWHGVHHARLILDEIFGAEQFQNEIVWCYREAINSRKRWNRKHDTLLFYSKSDTFTFNPEQVLEPYSLSTLKKFRHTDEKGQYRLMGKGITNSPLRSKRDIAPYHEIESPELVYRHYLGAGTLPLDWWTIDIENQASPHRTGYPTQKPEALLHRILIASTNEDDLIGDFCCGSGTTLAVAARIGRRWIGCDVGALAIETTRQRLDKASVSYGFYKVP